MCLINIKNRFCAFIPALLLCTVPFVANALSVDIPEGGDAGSCSYNWSLNGIPGPDTQQYQFNAENSGNSSLDYEVPETPGQPTYTPECTDVNKCIPVQLPSGSIRSAMNLKDNPQNLGAVMLAQGTVSTEIFTSDIGLPEAAANAPSTATNYTSKATGITYNIMGCYVTGYAGEDYLMINGENYSGAYIQFSLAFNCAEIQMVTSGACSTNAASTVNVYANGTKIGNYPANVQNSTVTVSIPAEYQAAGTVYKVESGSDSYDQQFISFSYLESIPDPEVTGQSESSIVTCDGRTVSMYIETSGGYEEGWKYVWSLNGVAIPGADANILEQTVVNNGTSANTQLYQVHVTNGLNDVVIFDETYTYTVQVYPAAKAGVAENTIDAYYGETANLLANYSGGYPSGWSIQWDTPNHSTNAANPITVESRNAENYSVTYNVTIANRYQEDVWFRDTFPVTLNAWSRGQVNAVVPDSIDFNHRALANLRVNTYGGYIGNNGGWHYQWYDNGSSIEGTAVYNVNETNNTRSVKSYDYSVQVENTLNGKLGCEENLNWTLRVWPEIIAPESIEISKYYIRAGESVDISTYPYNASGGYTPNGLADWSYIWSVNGQIVNTNPSFTVYPEFKASGKGSRDFTYSLTLKNTGPSGNPWYNKTFNSRSVRVYAAPLTPTSLQRKGNGTTCTMIAMSSLSDTELAAQDYYFVFGYTAPSGLNYEMEPTAERYQHFEPSVFNNSGNTFWVYCQWVYDDGSIITSGKRYIDGVNENFNGSSYPQSRSDYDGIHNVIVENPLSTDGHTFTAELSTPGAGHVRVYNSSGYIVKSQDYPSQLSFDEVIDLNGLTEGIYFVEVFVGQYKATSKIIINYNR